MKKDWINRIVLWLPLAGVVFIFCFSLTAFGNSYSMEKFNVSFWEWEKIPRL